VEAYGSGGEELTAAGRAMAKEDTGMALLKHVIHRLAIIGLLFGVMAGSPLSASGEDATAPEVEEIRNLITAEGHGEVRIRPDSLRTSVGVEARAGTLEQARSEVNTRMQQVIKAIGALRIPSASLQTQTLQFYPIYATDRNPPPRITGYSASNQITVTVLGESPTALGEQASRIIDAALQNGANTASGIDFFVRDPGPATGQALAAAVRDATRNARAMAEAAKVTIVELHSMQELPAGRVSPLRVEAAALDRGAPTPVETGEIIVSSNVTARFVFEQ
jgi:uncharacterized protein YggE